MSPISQMSPTKRSPYGYAELDYSPTRRPYVRPALWFDRPPAPQHWDLASGDDDLDIGEEDGYILSANGEGSASGVLVPCEPLSAVRCARPGRLRVKPWVLHRRRVLGITTSPASATASSRLRDCLPPTPSTPNTDFKNFYYNSLRQRDVPPVVKAASSEVPPALPLITPPVSPVVSRTPSSSLRHQRPLLHVQTSSPVGTSPPPPTPAFATPITTSQFRSSGRLPKRPGLPVWPAEYYSPVVVA